MDTLRGLHPVIDLIMRHRGVSKLKSTYVDALPALIHPRTHRIHTTFNQATAATGRLSSIDPNLQNIPVRTGSGNKIRRAFIARDIGKDPMLLRRLLADRAADHGAPEPGQGTDRGIRRRRGHPRRYGRERLRRAAGRGDVGAAPAGEGVQLRRHVRPQRVRPLYARGYLAREAGAFIKRYFEKYTGVRDWRTGAVERCRSLGYAETLMGRRRYIPEIKSPNYQIRSAGERIAINMPLQGRRATSSGGDEPHRRRAAEKKLETKMILQVHDELIFEGPRTEVDSVREMCLRTMPASLDLAVPLKVDIKTGKNWGELEVQLGRSSPTRRR